MTTRLFSIILLLFAFLVCAACVPNAPTPIVVTATPAIPPTDVPASNPHRDLPFESVVNPDSTLAGLYYSQREGAVVAGSQFRDIYIPEHYTYVGSTASYIPPHINVRGTDDFKFIVDSIGRPLDKTGQPILTPAGFGYRHDNIVLYGDVTYGFKARFSTIDLRPLDETEALAAQQVENPLDMPLALAQVWNPWNMKMYVRVYTSDGNSVILGPIDFPETGTDVDLLIGVGRTDKTMTVARVEWWWDIIYRTVNGSFVLTDLEIVTLPDDFGLDVRVDF